MHIGILRAESAGVCGLSCVVETQDRKIVIDPGLALGYQRDGLLPHPAQVAVGEQVRQRIVAALENATDVVVSHFHGDHVPLPDANPYQPQSGTVMMTRVPQCQARSRGPSSSQSSSMLTADKEPKVSQSTETTNVKTTRSHNAGNVI